MFPPHLWERQAAARWSRAQSVASLARPGGNATGINYFVTEVAAKRLALLHELVPNAVRVAVLVNPADATNTDTTLRDVQEAARAIGLQIQVLNAGTSGEIDAAFATLARDRPDVLFVTADGFFAGRRVQLVTLAAGDRIPAAYSQRVSVESGGLMSYGTDIAEMYRQVGVYTGTILKGANPADLPVVQSAKFEFIINLQTARLLGMRSRAPPARAQRMECAPLPTPHGYTAGHLVADGRQRISLARYL